ncbi:MAG: hypothetical protein KUG77_07975 [Nannocystaceae bacterium]|nr:hypothetical protein [Nannocystaceae bacterium]
MIWRWGPCALLSLLCIWGVVHRLGASAPSERASRQQPAPPQALALLDDLQVGEKLAGWTVLGITGPLDRVLRIDVAHGEIRFSVSIAARGAVPYPPPRTTETYDLYYGHPHPRDTEIPESATRAIMAGVERRVRRNESRVEVPGMGADSGP